MDDKTQRGDGLAKSVKIGVSALVVLAVVAVGAGGVWYFQRNALPTCGAPEATTLVTQIVSENLTKNLPPEQAATATKSVRWSLDLIEKGELTSDGHVRKCSAVLVAALDPEMKKFAAEQHTDRFFDGVRKESDDRFSVPMTYEIKALEGQQSPWAVSIPGSQSVAAITVAARLLASELTQVRADAEATRRSQQAVQTASTTAPTGTESGDERQATKHPANWNAMNAEQQQVWSTSVHSGTKVLAQGVVARIDAITESDGVPMFQLRLAQPLMLDDGPGELCERTSASALEIFELHAWVGALEGKTVTFEGTIDCPKGGWVIRNITVK